MKRLSLIILSLVISYNIVSGQSLEGLAEKALFLLDTSASADEKRDIWQNMPAHMAFLGQNHYSYSDLVISLPMLMIRPTTDSAYIFITGEARLDTDYFRYYGGIYHVKKKKWMSFIPSESTEVASPDELYSHNAWHGKLYYEAKSFKKGFRKYYVLMGYRYIDYFRREKTMEIVNVDSDEVEFGAPLIRGPKGERLGRFALEYAAEAPVFFNYDPTEKKIVFDHLIPFKGLYEGQGTVWVPDGSYSAFEWRKGFWYFLEKLPVLYSETPPGGQPTQSDSNRKDIIGRPMGKN
jgi:hypothetical protein